MKRSLTMLVLSSLALAGSVLLVSATFLTGAAPAAVRVMLDEDPPIVDSFNRGNENPLSDGGKWSALNGYALSVVSNQLASSNSTAQAWRNDVRYGLDQDVMVTVAVKPGSGAYNGHFVRLYVRLQMPSIWDGYALRLYNNTSGTDTVYLERFDGGGAATIATFPHEVFPGDRLRIRAIGPTIEALYASGGGGWTQLGTATDSTYIGVGLRRCWHTWDHCQARRLRRSEPSRANPGHECANR